MSNYAISLKRSSALLAALAFTALLLVVNFASFFSKADAAQLIDRSLTLSSTLAGDIAEGNGGTETNGSDVTYTFTFTPSDSTIGSVLFKACTEALGPCTAPTMPDNVNDEMFGAATLASTSLLEDVVEQDPWTLSATNLDAVDAECVSGAGGADGLKNCIAINNATPAGQAGTSVTIEFDGVMNPAVTEAFYVRITTFDDDAFGEEVDEGTVASAITEGITITARVAETLGFSVTGEFAGVGAPGTGCDPVTGSGAITLGDPANESTLSLSQAYDNYSAFRLYTNAANGVAVQYEGDTLRHSNTTDTIDPMDVAAVSVLGTEQFGLAIDTSVGGSNDVDSESRENMDMSNVNTAGELADADDGPLTIVADYADGDGDIQEGPSTAMFKFVTDDDPASRVADTIATTDAFTECKTVAVRYLANISPTTTSGTYTTTIVYSAVPTY